MKRTQTMMAYLQRKWNCCREHARPCSRADEFSPAPKSIAARGFGAKGLRNALNSQKHSPHAPNQAARTRAGVFATNVPFSLQVSHHCLCSFHIYDVLSLYFITHSLARSRGFRLLLPLNAFNTHCNHLVHLALTYRHSPSC